MQNTLTQTVRIFAVFICAWGVVATASARDAREGDTVEDVRKKMGRPIGEVRQGGQLLLLYDRGSVETYEGYVVKVDLMTPDDLRAQRESSERAMIEHNRRMRAQRDQRVTAGKKELTRIKNDEAFAEKPYAEQVAYWDDFKRKYPEVALPDAYEKARTELAKEEEAERKKREEEALAAAPAPTPKLSSGKRRKQNRRIQPGVPVETPPYLAKYRKVGGSVKKWPYD